MKKIEKGKEKIALSRQHSQRHGSSRSAFFFFLFSLFYLPFSSRQRIGAAKIGPRKIRLRSSGFPPFYFRFSIFSFLPAKLIA
ncbi:MAG: hypothetical protein ACRD5G_02520 [Candidatus Acidiferrales bacterium]